MFGKPDPESQTRLSTRKVFLLCSFWHEHGDGAGGGGVLPLFVHRVGSLIGTHRILLRSLLAVYRAGPDEENSQSICTVSFTSLLPTIKPLTSRFKRKGSKHATEDKKNIKHKIFSTSSSRYSVLPKHCSFSSTKKAKVSKNWGLIDLRVR